MLWQAAIPVGLGLRLSILVGLALGAVLVRMIPAAVHPDWPSLAAMIAAGGAIVLAVTALSSPLLWRLTRPDALRAE